MGSHKAVVRADAHAPGEVLDFVDVTEVAAPATPAAAKVRLYAKSDGLLYSKDDAGVETAVSGTGTGIAASIVDAKGDLIVATAADTVSRLAVGANDFVLTADSAEATGLKWAAAAGGSMPDEILYRYERLAGETAHASDDFFSAYSGYTELLRRPPTWAVSRGGLSATFSNVANANLAATLKAVPAAGLPITIETYMTYTGKDENNAGYGLIFTNGTATTATISAFGLMDSAGAGHNSWSSPTGTLNGVTSGLNSHGFRIPSGAGTYLRWMWTAVNTFEFASSPDGEKWVDWGTTTLARTITPTHMGFYVTNWNSSSSAHAVTFRYLRVYEADLSV